jgi:acetylornithine deacetylase/succinyl-diaminopimelate desuccinylase-like protein
MTVPPDIVRRVRECVNIDRLLRTAVALIEIPSPTRSVAAVADRLEKILREDGFEVERVAAGWLDAPAVVCRWQGTRPGRTLQFNGHLDTVHLPFVPPRVENGILYGSGSSDMKGGIAAAVEALRALRDANALGAGSILLTAHDLHETPWGDGSQVNGLIAAGCVGDGVLLPEYVADRLPVIGRGLAVWEVRVSRPGVPVHEVLGGIEQPNVIAAGSEVVRRFMELDQQLARLTHPLAGRESVFVGQMHGGEIFNQSPTELKLSGTRRWLPGTSIAEAERSFQGILSDVATRTGTEISGRFQVARDAYELDANEPLLTAFQSAHAGATGQPLPTGAKPFVDDGNAFVRMAGLPAISHGPNATGAHTLNERCPVSELARVALVYALTAVAFCGEP